MPRPEAARKNGWKRRCEEYEKTCKEHLFFARDYDKIERSRGQAKAVNLPKCKRDFGWKEGGNMVRITITFGRVRITIYIKK